jgi:DNA adenine methylase
VEAPRPFLKWVGGKGQLLEQFRGLLPANYGRYFEPFLGGGAVFFSQTPPRAVLSDVNSELVDCYVAIRDAVEDVIEALRAHRYEKAHYYEVRSLDPGSLALSERAARTIFLNRTGYNGLYRVNRRGGFNVPFGRYSNPRLCDPANLRACALALRGVDIRCREFDDAVKGARRQDFVYFDPPYVPVSTTSNFTNYVAGARAPREGLRPPGPTGRPRDALQLGYACRARSVSRVSNRASGRDEKRELES